MGQTRLVKLRYTLPALADLDSILDYIAVHSPRGMRRRIQAIIDLLLATAGADLPAAQSELSMPVAFSARLPA